MASGLSIESQALWLEQEGIFDQSSLSGSGFIGCKIPPRRVTHSQEYAAAGACILGLVALLVKIEIFADIENRDVQSCDLDDIWC